MKKKRIPFTSSAMPKILNYQSDQVDPEDAAKTINYAEDFGEDPDVKCIIVSDANNKNQLPPMPNFTLVDGLIDTIYFDIGFEVTGYLILS